MATSEWLLVFHLLGVFLFLSGSVVAGVLALAATRRRRPSEVALLLRLTRPAVAVVGVGSLVSFGFGLSLVHSTGYAFGEGWIVASIALWVVAIAVSTPGGTMMRHTRELAEQLAQKSDQPSDELDRALHDPRGLVLNGVGFAALLAILVLMTFKPGA